MSSSLGLDDLASVDKIRHFPGFLHVLFSSAVAHNIEMISLEGDRDE